MASPTLTAVNLGDDARVELEFVADGNSWVASFTGRMGIDMTTQVVQKYDTNHVLDKDSPLGIELYAAAEKWVLNNHRSHRGEGTTLESRALLANVMKELHGFWESTSARAHDDDVEEIGRMAAMFEERAIKQCIYAVIDVASSFHANRRKRGESIAARAAAEAVGAASPDPIDLINEFIKR